MEDQYLKIERFLSVCDELIEGKYILADTKISELLQTIAASRELTDLFSAVTEQFDFPAAKRACLRFPAERGAAHGEAFLPTERGDVLAFVFCLLVELDGGKMKLGDFLLRYFYEDGSYTASYSLFAGRMLRPFRDIVRDCFPDCDKKSRQLHRKMEQLYGALAAAVTEEQSRVAALSVSDGDREAGRLILTELSAAIGREDAQEVKALVYGYRYYLIAVGGNAQGADALLSAAEQL